MEKLLEILESTRQDTIRFADKMVGSYNLDPGDFPICGLNMLNSECVTLMEVITQYSRLWDRIERTPASSLLAHAYSNQKKENAQRIVNICKASFISSMSVTEYCAKETTGKFLNHLTAKIKTNIHLSHIIAESFNANIITEESKTLWKSLNDLRNCLVHNNGISEKNRSYVIDDTMTINMIKGRMISSTLCLFPATIKALVHNYNDWACAILDKSSYEPDLRELHQRTLNDVQKKTLTTLAKNHPNIKLMTVRQKSKESQNFSSSIENTLSSNGWQIEQFITVAPWKEQQPTISLHIKHKNLEAFDELAQLMQNIDPQIKVGIHNTTNFDIVLDVGIIACSPSQKIKDDISESQTVINPELFNR
ncbi:hypothetical protein EMIT0P43_170098 [Pseudomonas jessenii]|uniref:hypothetical protein n=1 Tax=Pseudomonas jessenii TaxID=77298 RepID=UPI0039E07533